ECGAPRRQAVPELARGVGPGVERTLGQVHQELRRQAQQAGAEPLDHRAASRVVRVASVSRSGWSWSAISAARASSNAPSVGSDGQIGLNEYHWAGAA